MQYRSVTLKDNPAFRRSSNRFISNPGPNI